MSDDRKPAADSIGDSIPAAHTVRLPRFIVKEPLGLGQIVKRMTSAIGVQPCGPCERRANRMDQWLRVLPSEHGGTGHG